MQIFQNSQRRVNKFQSTEFFPYLSQAVPPTSTEIPNAQDPHLGHPVYILEYRLRPKK